jgi:hypothetical protein
MTTRNQILQYLIDEYYEGDAAKASEATGFIKAQFDAWRSKQRVPRKQSRHLRIL